MSKQSVFPRVTAPQIIRCKEEKRKVVGLTAYDAVFAALEEEAGVDFLLVGDSAGNVIAGHATTIPMTMDAMLFLTRCVSRGTSRVMVVADMPFGSFQVSTEEALHNAIRFLKEGGAQAVKLEGAGYLLPTIRRMVEAGIPVMGHLGLTPQMINVFGGYGVQATTAQEGEQLIQQARDLEEAGCFAIVLEKIPASLAERVTEVIKIPTIGIGSGAGCDGQILVNYDLLGVFDKFKPRFVRHYMNGAEQIRNAVSAWVSDVREGSFPGKSESYDAKPQRVEPKAAKRGRKAE
ncbi:MAG: 3-methyl-2-oxobutanoate hydroxymethyltransferase [Calditrichaeota bacterium]|nr:3-methyl-2-oxobutanoate hydroxymethyltransferase [Calditrichota bacterium]MCB9366359.1 3-methyl-2-oxobutanoate hydroxymethyltransferase [Calditrichota bacterium]